VRRVPRTPAAVLVTLSALVAVSGCTKTLSLDLTVVEPCDQTDQALNGASSFTVSSTGTDADEVVAFNVDQGPQPGLVDAAVFLHRRDQRDDAANNRFHSGTGFFLIDGV